MPTVKDTVHGYMDASGEDGEDDDPEPFTLPDGDSAFRNAAMIQKLEAHLRELGFDEGEIEDRTTAVNERWDEIVTRRAQAWKAWARRQGFTKVRVHITQNCGSRVEPTKVANRWRCRLCLREISSMETSERDVSEA